MTSTNVQPYRDPNQRVAARVEDLLARMTLDEKLAQVGCVWSNVLVQDDAFSEQKAQELLANGTGHITRIGSTTALRPRESAAFIHGFLEIHEYSIHQNLFRLSKGQDQMLLRLESKNVAKDQEDHRI